MQNRVHSGVHADTASQVRFGPFELDLRRGELRKEGRKVRLQEQPFQILRMLLESPGDVVSRENIRQRLWPDDTVVEFEHSINAAVKRLRDALRESANNPRYIKTIARRGYSFIGELETVDAPVPAEPADITQRTERADQVPEPVLARSAEPHLRQSRIVAGGLLAAVLVMVGAGLWYYRRARRPFPEKQLHPLMRFELDLWNSASAPLDRGANAILSPDGMRLVYVSQSRLFARMLDQPNATELPGTEGAQAPFFSPDGKWVGFFAAGMLKKMAIEGRSPSVVCYSFADGGSWDEQGMIFGGLNFVLSRVSSTGGAPVPVTKLLQGEVVHRWPQILPGGKAVLFSAYSSLTGLEGANIEVVSVDDHRQKILIQGGTWGRYLPNGYLVYVNNGSLFAIRFDADRLEVHGAPTLILEGVAFSSAWGSAQLDFSHTGTVVFRDGRPGPGLVTVQWVDESGNKRSLLPTPGNYLSPTLSSDGKRLALIWSGDIWVYDLQSSTMVRVTFGGGYGNPVWTADGRYIVFRAARGMLWTSSDGTGQPQPLMQSANQQVPWSFTADGKRLAYVESSSITGADICTVAVDRDAQGLRAGKPEVFLQTRFDERSPMMSPDGRWLAYISNESGDYQVYVQGFPEKRNRTQISTGHGAYPAWSHNGHELFFWKSGVNDQLMVATYEAHEDSFVADRPRVWSEKGLIGFNTTRSYDPALDGKHAVALMPANSPQVLQNRVIVLLNFFDELRRRVPAGSN